MIYRSLVFGYIVFLFYQWMHVRPRVDWQVSSQFEFEKCEGEPVLIFGATSMLGRYMVSTLQEKHTKCLVSIARSNCKECDINIKADLRDARLVKRALSFYSPSTVITSIKPPITGVHYKLYIEINFLSMIQLIDISIEQGVKNFIYVGSIAAAGHYFEHHNATEQHYQPYYTDYEAPYDVSKRLAEDYLLSKQTDTFNTISIRLGGVIGGDEDPFGHLRSPVLLKYSPAPPGIDVNFAGNIAEALSVVLHRLDKLNGPCDFCGDFYYLTGVPMTENEKANIVAKATGKPVITIPFHLVEKLAHFLHWARFEVDIYSEIDLMRMGLVPQTFDQSKFFNTFPEYKEPMTLAEALKRIYSKVDEEVKEDL